MDPNAALQSILYGHMVADHAEALRDWLAGGGFAPEPIAVPVDCHPIFAAWPKFPWLVSAEAHGLRASLDSKGAWFMPYEHLLRVEDSE